MAIKARDYIAKLPESEQNAIKAEAQKLIAEELTLAELREAPALAGGARQETGRTAIRHLAARTPYRHVPEYAQRHRGGDGRHA